jgi:hypothetical protein
MLSETCQFYVSGFIGRTVSRNAVGSGHVARSRHRKRGEHSVKHARSNLNVAGLAFSVSRRARRGHAR